MWLVSGEKKGIESSSSTCCFRYYEPFYSAVVGAHFHYTHTPLAFATMEDVISEGDLFSTNNGRMNWG